MEAKLQFKIIVFLKEQGAYVIKTKPGPGTPVGCPDIIALYREKHLEIEVKADENAPFQPGQEATLFRLKSGNPYVYKVHPQNWEAVKKYLLAYFF